MQRYTWYYNTHWPNKRYRTKEVLLYLHALLWCSCTVQLGIAPQQVKGLVVCKTNENPWHADPQFLRPTLRAKP